jgi:hypothetical protein
VALDCIPSGAPAAEIILGAADVPEVAGVSASGAPDSDRRSGWTQQSKRPRRRRLILIKGEAGQGLHGKEIGATLAGRR